MKKMNILIIFLIILLFACSKTKEKQQHPEHHRFVANYTVDFNEKSPIKVRFSEKMSGNIKADPKLLKKCFSFNVSVDFSVNALNDFEVEIQPEKGRKFARVNKLIIDEKSLFDLDYGADIELPVKVRKNQIITVEPDFKNLGKKAVFKAVVELRDEITSEELKNSITLQLSNKDIEFTVSKRIGTGNQFIVETSTFNKTDKNQMVKLSITDDLIPLELPVDKEYNIASLHAMQVLCTYTKLVENRGTIEVLFSEEIDFSQRIENYVELKHDKKVMNVTCVKQSDRIILTGNLQSGKSYDLTLKKGILNKHNHELEKDYHDTIIINDVSPYIAFAESGNLYSTKGNNKVRIRSVNYSKIRVRIYRIAEKNMGHFIYREGFKPYRYNLYDGLFSRKIIEQELNLNTEKNKWEETDLDLSKIIGADKNGMYVVDIEGNSVNENVYANPTQSNDTKVMLISDLGITYKREAEDRHKVIVTNLITAKPESGCNVKIYDKQNILMINGSTDSRGMFDFQLNDKGFEGRTERKMIIITAENSKSLTILYPNKMQWNTSTFDVAGASIDQAGNSFVYTERGVYRPGDEINFSFVLRSADGTFPANQPVNIEIFNPRGSKKLSKTIKNGKDGFYTMSFTTDENAQTGTWSLKYSSGGIKGSHSFKVETVVAERLKVEITPEKNVVNVDDKSFKIDVKSQYLFGAPASNLKYKVNAEISKVSKKIQTLPGFIFDDVTTSFKRTNVIVGEGNLDKNGDTQVKWKIPDLGNSPASLMAVLKAEVIDNGGRASKATKYVDINPYSYYVGIKLPDDMHIRSTNKVKVALIDVDGKLVPGEDLTLSIYHKSRYWWYERGRTSRNSYKANDKVALVYSQNLKSDVDPLEVDIDISNWGEYLIEVTHSASSGHTAAQYFYPYWYGSKENGAMDDGILSLKTDKKTYKSGETAKVQFDAPEKSVVLVSLESKGKILKTYWDNPKVKDGKGEISFRVDDSMIPNGYCTISVIQPVENENDLPVRTYGVVPISVFEERSKNAVSITTSESFRSKKKFNVEIRTERKEKSQVTIAVVDEGLLSLTNFRSPDPWGFFYRKIIHSVISFDNYGFVSGLPQGDPYKSFLIGGDLAARAAMERDLRKRRKLSELTDNKKRFKPVCMYSGILETDENGYLKHEFTMPEYIGAVRIMAVVVNGKTYDSAEKTVPVKENLMVKATFPRFLNTGNKFSIPVEIFKDKDVKGIKNVDVSIETDSRIEISGSGKKTVTLNENGQAVVKFAAESNDVLGFSHITVKAVSGKYKAESNTDINIYSPNPTILKSENKKVKKGEYIEFTIPDDGYKGSMDAAVTVNTLENLDVSNRLKWLIKYPYGCIEQTTSSVFPQLYLGDFIRTKTYKLDAIDRNINAGISRLKKFQVSTGGLGYWPGSYHVSEWGTMYAGHFLFEAKKKGYFVPETLIKSVLTKLRYDTRNFIADKKDTYAFRTQVMKLYLLTLAEKPDESSMNIIYESYLGQLNRTYRLLLAAAYLKIGDKKTSDIIMTKLNEPVADSDERNYYRRSWGSGLRDEGLTLLALTELNADDEAYTLFNSIARKINNKNWYSTQTLGYTLTALGKYYIKHKDTFDVDNSLSCYVEFADKSRKRIKVSGNTASFDLGNHFGEKIKVHFEESEKLKTLYVALDWSGVIKDERVENVSDNMTVTRKWKNSSGKYVDPGEVKQGDILTCELTVKINTNLNKDNIALVQALPAGWEIENERLQNKTASKKTNYDYLDIRDDRIMWFFSIDNYKDRRSKTFSFKVRAVTSGEFMLPPTYCEAMYDNNYKAVLKGSPVKVIEKK